MSSSIPSLVSRNRPKPLVLSSSESSSGCESPSFIGITCASSPNLDRIHHHPQSNQLVTQLSGPKPPPRPSKSSLIQQLSIRKQQQQQSQQQQVTSDEQKMTSNSSEKSTSTANSTTATIDSAIGLETQEKNLTKHSKSVNTNNQSHYNASQSSVEDDPNWYSHLFLNPISPRSIANGNHRPTSYRSHYRHHPSLTNGVAPNKDRKVKRSSTFNSDDLTVGEVDDCEDLDGHNHETPSPSDSGIVGDPHVNQLLREKDAEIAFLRETLEQNEAVIFKVYEEKENSWKREFIKLRTQFENSLSVYQKKVLELEQELLTIRESRLDSRIESRNDGRDSRAAALEESVSALRKEVEDLLTQRKTSETALSELKNQNGELTKTLEEMTNDLEITKNRIEEERERWKEEKEKVLLYQKQLNQTNLNILKRNKELEAELRTVRYTVKEDDTTYWPVVS